MKKRILSSIVTISICLCLIAGSTFALFTTEDRVDIAVTAGTVSVSAYLDSFRTYSMDVPQADMSFANGGTAAYEQGILRLDRINPGDRIEFNVNVENNSNVYVDYRIVINTEDSLGEALEAYITFEGENAPTLIDTLGNETSCEWLDLASGNTTLPMSILFPQEKGNEYQGGSASIAIKVEAIQKHRTAEDPFEVKSPVTDDAGAYHVTTPGQMIWLANEVNAGSMSGKTLDIVIEDDIDFEGMQISSMGNKSQNLRASIKGEKPNGEGITVSNFVINEPSGEGVGLFGFMNGSISGICVDGATVSGYHWTAGLVGYIYGSVTDCSVKNSTVTCADKALFGFFNGDKCGALIGYLGDGNYKITNCHAENVNVFANRDGAQLIGYAQPCTVTNCTATNVTVTWNGSMDLFGYKKSVKNQLISNIDL